MSAVPRLTLLCVLAAGAAVANAPPPAPEGAVGFAPTTTARMTKARAVRIVRARFGGRILSAGAVHRDGEGGFDVRVLTDGGRIKNVFVDRRGTLSED